MGAGSVAIRLCAAHPGIKKMINTSKIYKMRIVFRWTGNDTLQADGPVVLRERLLKSGLSYVPVKGRPGCPRISYGPPLGREVRAERDYADIYFWRPVSEEILRERLSDKIAGLEVLEAYRVPYAFASVQNLAEAAAYRVEGDFSAYAPAVPAETYFNAPQLKITRQADNGMTFTWDVKPFVHSLEILGPQSIRLIVRSVAEKWVSSQELIAAWLGVEKQQLSNIQFIRERLFWQDTGGTLHPL